MTLRLERGRAAQGDRRDRGERRDGSRDREPWRAGHELVRTRVVDAPMERVWEAWTSPDHLPRWLTGPEGWTLTTCEIELRAGGSWRLIWRRADGTELPIRGVYEEVRAPERLVSTSSWGDDWPDTVETLVLAGEGGRTRVTQRTVYESEEALDAAVGNGVDVGMAEALESLAAYLAGSPAGAGMGGGTGVETGVGRNPRD